MDEKKGALSHGDGEKKSEHHGGEHKSGGGGKHPHMHVHSHDAGHTMHVMHADGSHEMHHFAKGDTAGMKSVMDEHYAGGGEMGEGGGEGGGEAEPEQGAE